MWTLTKARLIALLEEIQGVDPEVGHATADDLLIAYIDDAEIAAAYKAIRKWYA